MIAPMPKKVGIIGAGVIGDFHAEALNAMHGAELVAAYARRDERAQAFAQAHGCSAYSDLGQFLAHEGMDVVTVASVSGAHLDHVEAAAQGRETYYLRKAIGGDHRTDRPDDSNL